MREFLSVKEIARTLGVGESFVRIRIWRKELPAYRVGAQLRVHIDDLHAWLNSHRTDPERTRPLQEDEGRRWLEERLRELGEPGQESGEATGGAK